MMTADVRPATPLSGTLFDELLVVMVQQGDRKALDRLHARWDKRLVRAAYRYTGDPELARDLAQECWIGIWKGIGTIRDPARFRSFAFAILHRRGADHLRSAIRRRDNETVSGEPPAGIEHGRADEALAISQAFAKLPPALRLAAHLHFVEGLTLAEIAAVQDIPTGTAKSRLFHARRQLKAALDPEPPQGDLP